MRPRYMSRRNLLSVALISGGSLALAGCESMSDIGTLFDRPPPPIPGDRKAVFPEGVPGDRSVPQPMNAPNDEAGLDKAQQPQQKPARSR